HLLSQGASEAIKDEIIALSEEYQIITPYTSFLVLETDADRERFKVKRHFRMRDGERFFAEGRGNANAELRQQQMRRAGTWRLGLRRLILAQLGALGRSLPQLPVLRNERFAQWNLGLPLSSPGVAGEPWGMTVSPKGSRLGEWMELDKKALLGRD